MEMEKIKKQLSALTDLTGAEKTEIANKAGVSLSSIYSYINGNIIKFEIAHKILTTANKVIANRKKHG